MKNYENFLPTYFKYFIGTYSFVWQFFTRLQYINFSVAVFVLMFLKYVYCRCHN